VHGLRGRRVARLAFRQVDVTGGEERAHAVVTRAPVDVVVVVLVGELLEPRDVRVRSQEGVERLLPRGAVLLGGAREHTVEVEQTGRHMVREADHRRHRIERG
jgi:hypothetical protein